MHDFEDDEDDEFESFGHGPDDEHWHATLFLRDLLGPSGSNRKKRKRAEFPEGSGRSTLGRVASGMRRVSSGIGNVSSTLGRVSSGIGRVSAGLGGVSSALGGVGSSLGSLSSTVGHASSSLGGVASGIGRASSSVSHASSTLGGIASEAGRVSSAVGGVSAALGGVSSSIGNLSSSLGRPSSGPSFGAAANITSTGRAPSAHPAVSLGNLSANLGHTSARVGRAFDNVLRFGESTDEAWEAIALPNSATPESQLRRGDLVLQRAQGANALGRARVFGESVGPAAVYAPSGRIRRDILVLRRRDVRSKGAQFSHEFSEAVPQKGSGSFRYEPLGGDGDNVEARWNVDASTPSGSTIDIVVHLHGYGEPRPDFIAHKAKLAGVDLVDTSGNVLVRAQRPTLVLVPRGNRREKSTKWFFSRLSTEAKFNALVDAGLAWLASSVLGLSSGASLTRGRLTLMAHSGGGAGINQLLSDGLNPDEVVCFDSTYGSHAPIRDWMRARLKSANAATSALRVFYIACGSHSWSYNRKDLSWHLSSTEIEARRLQKALDSALSKVSGGAALATRYRVERTTIKHNDIPAMISPVLLDDITAEVPKHAGKARAFPPPSYSQRPACASNDDWLTRPIEKPGGYDPPLDR